MRISVITFACLFILPTSTLSSEPVRKPTPIAFAGETVLVATSEKLNIKVIIKTRKIEKEIGEGWGKKLSFVPSACTYSSWCSIVGEIDIIVNGAKIFIPQALLPELANISTADIKLDERNMIIILCGGDASDFYVVKIEFDRRRVKRMSVFAGDSMTRESLLQESTYHIVVVK